MVVQRVEQCVRVIGPAAAAAEKRSSSQYCTGIVFIFFSKRIVTASGGAASGVNQQVLPTPTLPSVFSTRATRRPFVTAEFLVIWPFALLLRHSRFSYHKTQQHTTTARVFVSFRIRIGVYYIHLYVAANTVRVFGKCK